MKTKGPLNTACDVPIEADQPASVKWSDAVAFLIVISVDPLVATEQFIPDEYVPPSTYHTSPRAGVPPHALTLLQSAPLPLPEAEGPTQTVAAPALDVTNVRAAQVRAVQRAALNAFIEGRGSRKFAKTGPFPRRPCKSCRKRPICAPILLAGATAALRIIAKPADPASRSGVRLNLSSLYLIMGLSLRAVRCWRH